jgi:hypothetical protein
VSLLNCVHHGLAQIVLLAQIPPWGSATLKPFAEHPLSNVRRRRQATATAPADDNHGTDGVVKAQRAWRRFKAAVEALPADQAALIWQAVRAEAQQA